MKNLIILFSVSWIVLMAPPVFAADTLGASCRDFSNTVTKQVVDIFHEKNKTPEQKQQELGAIFQAAVDIDWIGKFVLGSPWKAASPAQQKSYLETYRSYLTTVYISKLNDEDENNIDDIVVASIKPQQGPGQFEAKTIVKRTGHEDVEVDYALDQSSGKCQVHDIKVENVSLLVSERSEFKSIASTAGIDGVTNAMKKQLADN